MTTQSAIDAWRERILAHDREATALRSGHTPGHTTIVTTITMHTGHEDEPDGSHVHGGHGGFSYTNRPRDIHRTDDPAVNALFALIDSDATILDVGGGAGRFALPLATRAEHVTVIEPSDEAVGILQESRRRRRAV